MVSTWAQFVWLARQAADGVAYGWPITLGLTVALVLAVLSAQRRGVPPMRGGWALQLVSWLVPVGILALGAIYRCEHCVRWAGNPGVRHVWAETVAASLFLGQLLLAAWLIAWARARWVVAVVLQAFGLWWLFWASWLAGMSLSGDWI